MAKNLKNVDSFLRELTALSQKYGIVIGGCGCCGSPLLMPTPKKEEEGFYLVDGGNECLEWGLHDQ